MADLSATRGQL